MLLVKFLLGNNYFQRMLSSLRTLFHKILPIPQKILRRKYEMQVVFESESCSVMTDSLQPHGLYSLWNSPGQNTGMGSPSLLQGISPTQRLNPGLPRCRWILYQLSQEGSPRILEWVAYPFSSRSSQSRNQTRVSCTAGDLLQVDSLSAELPRKQIDEHDFSYMVYRTACSTSYIFASRCSSQDVWFLYSQSFVWNRIVVKSANFGVRHMY